MTKQVLHYTAAAVFEGNPKTVSVMLILLMWTELWNCPRGFLEMYMVFFCCLSDTQAGAGNNNAVHTGLLASSRPGSLDRRESYTRSAQC